MDQQEFDSVGYFVLRDPGVIKKLAIIVCRSHRADMLRRGGLWLYVSPCYKEAFMVAFGAWSYLWKSMMFICNGDGVQ